MPRGRRQQVFENTQGSTSRRQSISPVRRISSSGGPPHPRAKQPRAIEPLRQSVPTETEAADDDSAESQTISNKKSAILTIVLNHIFWNVSHKPSAIQLQQLFKMLQLAQAQGLILDDIYDIEFIRVWFRNKRFHTRKILYSFLDADLKGIKFLDALANVFRISNLADLHEVLDSTGHLVPLRPGTVLPSSRGADRVFHAISRTSNLPMTSSR